MAKKILVKHIAKLVPQIYTLEGAVMSALDQPSYLLCILTPERNLFQELVKNAPCLVYSNQPYVVVN